MVLVILVIAIGQVACLEMQPWNVEEHKSFNNKWQIIRNEVQCPIYTGQFNRTGGEQMWISSLTLTEM